MSEENKAIIRRLYEEFINQGNVNTFDELVSSDVVEHEEMGDLPPGAEGVKQFFAMFRAAFPDLRANIGALIAEEDIVVARGTWSASHKGEFMGVPPSGTSVTLGVIDIFRIVDGKVTEHWGQSDMLGLMQQIGAIPGQ